MSNLQFGDTVEFITATPIEIKSILDVAPIKYNSVNEQWVVCAQKDATHMLIVFDTDNSVKYFLIEIGKCNNIYLLADAIVD